VSVARRREVNEGGVMEGVEERGREVLEWRKSPRPAAGSLFQNNSPTRNARSSRMLRVTLLQ
jgi:hypothetical protein